MAQAFRSRYLAWLSQPEVEIVGDGRLTEALLEI